MHSLHIHHILNSVYPIRAGVYTISGLDYWTGLDWTTGLTVDLHLTLCKKNEVISLH